MAFSQEQADRICAALIEEQLTLRKIAERERISKGLILKNVAKDEAFRDQYARAMDIRTDADFEGLDDDVEAEPERLEDGRIDPGWVQLHRVRIDTKKWKLSKRNPKKYSEKIQSEVSGPDGAAISMEWKGFIDYADNE